MRSRHHAKHAKTRATEELVAELTVRELAPGGDGVATLEKDGERRAVFLRGVAPGDVVRASIDARVRPARGRVLEIVSAGPARAAAALPCAFVATCGGCDWMHVADDARRAAHAAHLTAALPGAWRERFPKVEVHAAPAQLGYRSRARLHVRASGGRAIVGVHAAATHEPVEVDRCVVLEPALDAARASLSSLFEGTHGRGDVQIARGAGSSCVADVRWSGSALPSAFWARLERAVASGDLAGARVTAGEASRPAIVGDPTPWMTGADGDPLRLAPGGFAQASEEGNRALATRVAELARAAGPDAGVVELYAGAGNFTVLLARDAARVVAVETSKEACAAAEANLRARGLDGKTRVVVADAAEHGVPNGTSLVVLDPPRTGARAVCEALAAKPAKRVIYVSCDTSTLARDLAILEHAYAPVTVEGFELFPQTSHVEAVVMLERAREGRSS